LLAGARGPPRPGERNEEKTIMANVAQNVANAISSITSVLTSSQVATVTSAVSSVVGNVPAEVKAKLDNIRGAQGQTALIESVIIDIEKLGTPPGGAIAILNALATSTDPVAYQNEITAVETLYANENSGLGSLLSAL
jgi:hypothetical protein